MSNFKVGDKVRRTTPGMHNEGMRMGDVYTVKAAEAGSLAATGSQKIRVEETPNPWWYNSENFALVKRTGATKLEGATAVVPEHYAFPGGVRVHQISGHLTSFGGQALQYIARSTRLDGNNKGDTAENLRKAIRFLELEIERVGSAQ